MSYSISIPIILLLSHCIAGWFPLNATTVIDKSAKKTIEVSNENCSYKIQVPKKWYQYTANETPDGLITGFEISKSKNSPIILFSIVKYNSTKKCNSRCVAQKDNASQSGKKKLKLTEWKLKKSVVVLDSISLVDGYYLRSFYFDSGGCVATIFLYTKSQHDRSTLKSTITEIIQSYKGS